MAIVEKLKEFFFRKLIEPLGRVSEGLELLEETQAESANGSTTDKDNNFLLDRKLLALELSDALRLIVDKHGKTLEIKMRQLAYQDAYGNFIFDKFHDERDYFIKNVMCRDVPSEIVNFLFGPESFSAMTVQLFNESFNEYRSRNKDTQSSQINIEKINSIEYEQLCSKLLEDAGWHTRLTKASGDQGVDVIATHETIRVVGQCKLYSSPVGNSAVQEIIAGREFEKANYAFVVSNAEFTPAARALASSANVLLLHHSELADLHRRLNISLPLRQRVRNSNPSQVSKSSNTRICRPLNEIVTQATNLLHRFDAEGFGTNPHELAMGGCDPLYDQAVEIVVRTRRPSISLVQRHLRIGYNRAARLIEDMERAGLVSSMQTDGNREVLVPEKVE